MQYSQNFYTNVVLFVLALVVLGLSIWAFVAPCKKDGFGNPVGPFGNCCKNADENYQWCKNSPEGQMEGGFNASDTADDMKCDKDSGLICANHSEGAPPFCPQNEKLGCCIPKSN